MSEHLVNAKPDHDGPRFRCPDDLRRTDAIISRALLIGQCTADHIRFYLLEIGIECDFVHLQSMMDPDFEPPYPYESYEFQIVILPFDRIMPPESYFSVGFGDEIGEINRFESSKRQMHHLLNQCIGAQAKYKILTFVGNFLIPQQNPMGKLLKRYDLRNPVYFVEKINEELHNHIESMHNAYILDIDGISSTFGKKFVMDDSVWSLAHGGFFTDVEYNNFDGQRTGVQKRLDALGPISAYYTVKTHDVYVALREEIISLYRTVRQIDAIKLVVVDLDDTSWRGIFAENDNSHEFMTLGWPVGFVETLSFLKKRGIILAIISKNDEDVGKKAWNFAYGNMFPLENFAKILINWRPKHQNMQEILKSTNILPGNTIYVDDNPTERQIVQQAFPEMRVIGDNPYYTRRILLWAPETQVPFISAESLSRTESIKAVIARESDRAGLSHRDFLLSLHLSANVEEVSSVSDSRFQRTLELLNKTNQFNTTGKRWTIDEFSRSFADRMSAVTIDVTDKFTDYGLVCIALIRDDCIEQVVMSCRVIGLGIEQALIAVTLEKLRDRGVLRARALAVTTEKNVLSRDLFKRCEFEVGADGQWSRDMAQLPVSPVHISLHAAGKPVGAVG